VIRIGKTFRFEAAHVLPNHTGKCSRPHGHSYQVEVVFAAPALPERQPGASSTGMLIDFGDVSRAWKAVEDEFDHRNLNDRIPASYHPTTAENIARYLLLYFQSELPDLLAEAEAGVHVEKVRVWETATGWAEAWA